MSCLLLPAHTPAYPHARLPACPPPACPSASLLTALSRLQSWCVLLLRALNVMARHAACHPSDAALEQPGGLSGRHVEWRQDEALFLRWTRGQVGRPTVR